MSDKPYSVNLHSADPRDPESDACDTGEDFATLEEARACIADFLAGKPTCFDAHIPGYYRDVPYIELDGPDVNEVTPRPDMIARQAKRREADDGEWKREQAMQAGMGMGVDAYNDAMGYDSEEY